MMLFASWIIIVWKPKSLSTSTQEPDVICRDSVNTGIAPEALVEDVIVREAYKVFLQNPQFYSNNVFHFGHMSTDSPNYESAYIVIIWTGEELNCDQVGIRDYKHPRFPRDIQVPLLLNTQT